MGSAFMSYFFFFHQQLVGKELCRGAFPQKKAGGRVHRAASAGALPDDDHANAFQGTG